MRNSWQGIFVSGVLVAMLSPFSRAQEKAAVPNAGLTVHYKIERNIPYRTGVTLDDYSRERCNLDIYYPVKAKDFSTVVWFHGGGLKNGAKAIPPALKNKGLAIVAVNYRLSPRAKAPAYIEDAAAAVAWTLKNIDRYGGSRRKVIVAGHSAGGYLTSMVGLDKRWLAAHDVDANEIAGLVPYSGQAITHYTIRAERGIPEKQAVIDDLAPVFHVRKDAPPLLIISGDRNNELLGRYEETAYFWRMLKEVGHSKSEILELQGFNHGQMVEPGHLLLLRFIEKTVK